MSHRPRPVTIMPLLACPTDDRLRAFDRGNMPEDEIDTVVAHLGDCDACVARMAQVSGPIPGLDPASLSGPASVPNDSAYRRAVAKIADQPSSLHAPLPAVGDTLRDYRLTEVIGRGGMGVVFRAVHAKLDKVVAVKVMSGKRWLDPTAVTRFEREMLAIGRLSHANIVQATDADDANGVPFLVMEFVDGENLSALVKRAGPLPLAEACRLIRQAAAGLQHAHRAGVIHRDVKPSNLILATDGTVKVLDLGLALPLTEPAIIEPTGEWSTESGGGTRRNRDLTGAGLMIGTLDYMAPEQKRDAHAVDGRADIYGLGATLWFLMTGNPPQVPSGEAVLPGGLPRAFWDKFLAFDPADRHLDMASASTALAAVVQPAKPQRIWPALFVVGLIVALVVGIIWVASIGYNRSAPTEPTESLPPPPRVAPKPGKNPMTPGESQALQAALAEQLGQKVTESGPAGVKTVLIPPGEFEMYPRYRVTLTRPFRLGATEVTRGQFAAFVADTNYKTTGQLAAPLRQFGAVVGPAKDSGNWLAPGFKAESDHPITHVSQADALAYVEWLSKVEGRTYRLPTEAEWRWACRAGAVTRYPFGDDPKPLREYAHYKVTSDGQPASVGVRRPNAWGLYDMLGNVREWAQDGMAPIREGDFVDPLIGPRRDGMRVCCGGDLHGRTDVPDTPGWWAASCDCNTRGGHHWYIAQPTIGFRVARDP